MQQQSGLATDTSKQPRLASKTLSLNERCQTKYYVSCDSIYKKFLEKEKAIEIGCFLGTGVGAGMDWTQVWRTPGGEGCVLKLPACTTSYICYTIYQTAELGWMSFGMENNQLRKLLILRVKKGKA